MNTQIMKVFDFSKFPACEIRDMTAQELAQVRGRMVTDAVASHGSQDHQEAVTRATENCYERQNLINQYEQAGYDAATIRAVLARTGSESPVPSLLGNRNRKG